MAFKPTKKYNPYVNKLTKGQESIKSQHLKMLSAKKAILASESSEEMATLMTVNAGAIFFELVSVHEYTIEFNQETMVALVQDAKEMIRLDWKLVQTERYLDHGMVSYGRGLDWFDQMCEELLKNNSSDVQEKVLQHITEYINDQEKFAEWKTRQESQLAKKVFDELDFVSTDLTKHIDRLNNEKDHLISVEEASLGTLTKLVERLADKKVKENVLSQEAADKAKAALNTARRYDNRANQTIKQA